MSRARSPRLTTALAAIVLTGLNLRIAVVAVGPLVNQIQATTGMSSAVAGLLTTIPFFFMGASVLFGDPLINRFGPRNVILIGLITLALGCIFRSLTDQALIVVLATVPVGIGISLMGLALPSAIKEFTPHQISAATAAYVAALAIGVGIVGLVAVPLADLTGSWRIALLIFCLPTLMALVAWMAPVRAVEAAPPANEEIADAGPIRGRARRAVIILTLTFATQSFVFVGVINWAPAALVDGGWSEHVAAIGTALLGFLNALGAMTFSRLSRRGNRRTWLAAAIGLQTIGAFGLALFPGATGLFWTALFGFGAGSAFALMLSIPVYMAADPRQLARMSAWMMGVGYTVAAAGSWMVGAMRDGEIGLSGALLILGVVCFVAALIALTLPPNRAPKRDPAAVLSRS